LAISALRRSAGSLCTTPPGSLRPLIGPWYWAGRPLDAYTGDPFRACLKIRTRHRQVFSVGKSRLLVWWISKPVLGFQRGRHGKKNLLLTPAYLLAAVRLPSHTKNIGALCSKPRKHWTFALSDVRPASRHR
jgi:hypothetical protein